MGEGNENLVYPSLWDFKRSFTRRKILRHVTSSFTSHPKEGVLWIFIDLKNSSPWPGSNPRPLGTVASTLTTTTQKPPCSRVMYGTALRLKNCQNVIRTTVVYCSSVPHIPARLRVVHAFAVSSSSSMHLSHCRSGMFREGNERYRPQWL
jgi:hypothetical protein